MNNILKAWNAGFVRRWHTQPRLVDFDDRNHGHQQRCTVLLLLFWPDSSRGSIIDVITHDQGEVDIGDIARPVKHAHPEIRELAAGVEHASIIEQGFQLTPITGEELRRRKFVDILDSYVWMLRHKPSIHLRPEWVEQLDFLLSESKALGILPVYETFIQQAFHFYI